MALSRLDIVASTFQNDTEGLHNRFLAMTSDLACVRCESSRFGHAIKIAWLQNAWSIFTQNLLVASAIGTRRMKRIRVRPAPGIKSQRDAERLIKEVSSSIAKASGAPYPVWHAPWFVVEVARAMRLRNLEVIELAIGPARVPAYITDYRNYLVHPSARTRGKYDVLLARLGMLHVTPEELPRQEQTPGLPLFTSWIRELQRIADASIK